MHTKALYVRPRSLSGNQSAPCFAYVGSANLSESAWYVLGLSLVWLQGAWLGAPVDLGGQGVTIIQARLRSQSRPSAHFRSLPYCVRM